MTFAPCVARGSEEKKAKEAEEKPIPGEIFSGLKARSIGPAFMSGRIGDFAVEPQNRAHFYAAVCSGGVWKTTNAGTTWTPVFDSQGSYSIGCLAMDPNNPNVVWVGTGENNSQRSVSFGDGVYRTLDGGKSWKNLGLGDSEHIGMIAIDPRNSSTVYVAAQGPLWRSGGDRGLYRTTDGGATWTRILHVSDDTGVNEVHLDPRNPDVIYASSYQRRRRVWTLIDGGPESAIYKSTDGGASWHKLESGIPGVDKGRIGLDLSPADPDVLYAIIEAAEGQGGVFRSTDRGETWEKRCDYVTTSPQYYNEILCDPKNVDRLYALDTLMHVTEDGGRTFQVLPRQNRHVDDHALWIDPADTDYLLVGCDGGIYESFDRGRSWAFKPNLPVTQFYRVSTDNSTPFYYVYGGTQDNNSEGGPSRTLDRGGITNADWFITVGGDGYETVVDPEDPNIIYSQWQYGGLVRYDRRSGEEVDIKPREAPGEKPVKWNWDTPLILSPHNRKRLYFAGSRLYRSDDQGNSWTAISGDLTRGIDRNQLEVMGRIQNVDAVAKDKSTSFYGNAVSLAESPLVEGLIYVGMDDGLVHITGDGGKTWRKISLFPGIPDLTYVSCLTPSGNDAGTVYAAFDNHKNGDFKPYLLKSTDRGESWTPISGDLPARNIVYSIREDHRKRDLLFAGTEFGAYFSLNGGKRWNKIGGLPTISVRDIDLQRRENDVVLGTFGRGIYILDDYTPLRHVTAGILEKEAHIFPVKDALRYIQRSRLGGSSGKGSQGASYYGAPNPPFGAVFTYYLKEKLTTRRERRKEAEKKAGKPYRPPDLEELRAEENEKTPQILLIIRDDAGKVIRRFAGSRQRGIHRVAWDLRYNSSEPVAMGAAVGSSSGPLALPGTYTVTLVKEVDSRVNQLTEPVPFNVIPLELATFAAKDRKAVLDFQKKIARLQRALEGTIRVAGEAQNRIELIRKAILETPALDLALLQEVQNLETRLGDIRKKLQGDRILRKYEEPSPPSIRSRIRNVVSSQWNSTLPPTRTQEDAYRYAGKEFEKVLADLRSLVERDIAEIEKKLEAAGAPWTPGRIPSWRMED